MNLSFAAWADVLAHVESVNSPEAWGDAGRAMGRWQMHPAFVRQWEGPARLGMTWDDVCREALLRFWNDACQLGLGDVDAACGFHLHGQPRGKAADAPDYAARFREWAAKLGHALA